MTGLAKGVRNEILYLLTARVPATTLLLKGLLRYYYGLKKEGSEPRLVSMVADSVQALDNSVVYSKLSLWKGMLHLDYLGGEMQVY
jgi:hypothetical protein